MPFWQRHAYYRAVYFILFSWMWFIFATYLYMKYYYCDSLYFIYFLQEAAETKRKNAKRTFKSEKEFLEFTLKYQQVLTERDAGEFEGIWLSLYLINLLHLYSEEVLKLLFSISFTIIDLDVAYLVQICFQTYIISWKYS